MDLNQLKIKSLEYRKTILDIIYKSGAGHTGGSLSCIDILNVLYNSVLDINPKNFNEKDRNHYIHSKGHSVEALYTVLCDQGFFSKKILKNSIILTLILLDIPLEKFWELSITPAL